MFECTDERRSAWRFEDGKWWVDEGFLKGLSIDGKNVLTASGGRDLGARLRDLDGDGQCEFIVANANQQAVFEWHNDRWNVARYSLPADTNIANRDGGDAGLRFEDLDGDGDADIVFSDDDGFGIYVFDSRETGWRTIHEGSRAALSDEAFSIPPIVSNGMNNGAWFHSGTLWWQNEDTDELPDGVDRRSYAELLASTVPR